VAVRADLADDLDLDRLFSESIAEFGAVDVVVDTAEDGTRIHEHASRRLRAQGLIVSTCGTEVMTAKLEVELGKREITVGRVPPAAAVAFLERWRQPNHT
jgi:NAD(P)-dependent dehydrogenase (short-subunit alcohol dehydrogenase family)